MFKAATIGEAVVATIMIYFLADGIANHATNQIVLTVTGLSAALLMLVLLVANELIDTLKEYVEIYRRKQS